MGKLIGKGMFTKVYDNNDGRVTVKSSCPMKEAVALFCQGIGGTNAHLIPISNMIELGVYIMPKYTKVTAPRTQLKPDHYALYAWLRGNLNEKIGYSTIMDILATCPHKWAVAYLLDMVCAMSDYENEDLGFEISPRNIAIDRNNDLVLLDCFVSRRMIRQARK
jgi:hypothetical protein